VITILLALSLVGAGAAYAVTARASAEDTVGRNVRPSSYAFDVYDERALMDHSREVLIGRVARRASVEEEASSTIWTVEVLRSIKGEQWTGQVQVEQLGCVDGKGSVLQPGQDYLFATSPMPSGG
jgi:hypothetical protein